MTGTTMIQLLLAMVAIIFTLGMLTFIAGVFVLSRRTTGKEVQVLASQTTRLAQKGIAEDIAGLVGNANTLLDTLNQLLRTSAGIGIFLTLLGIAMMGAACWLAIQVYGMAA